MGNRPPGGIFGRGLPHQLIKVDMPLFRIRITVAALAVLMCLCWASLAMPAVFDQREVLRGLKGLKVVVESLPTDIERLGLTKRDVMSDVETRLRQAGIKVYPNFMAPSMTALYVNIHIINPPQARNFVVYTINVLLMENSYLKRDVGTVGDLKEVRAADWIKSMVGILPITDVRDIRKKLDRELSKFISDYFSVN
jgi:hypothetical protein